jgi:hypothetical protein
LMEVERKWKESEMKSLWNTRKCNEIEMSSLDKMHAPERLEYENESNSIRESKGRFEFSHHKSLQVLQKFFYKP